MNRRQFESLVVWISRRGRGDTSSDVVLIGSEDSLQLPEHV
jgi:hypothetical protein